MANNPVTPVMSELRRAKERVQSERIRIDEASEVLNERRQRLERAEKDLEYWQRVADLEASANG